MPAPKKILKLTVAVPEVVAVGVPQPRHAVVPLTIKQIAMHILYVANGM